MKTTITNLVVHSTALRVSSQSRQSGRMTTVVTSAVHGPKGDTGDPGAGLHLETFTLTSTNITNGYVDLVAVAHQDSVAVAVAGAGEQCETDDYSVNYTGGTSSKTRITFAGGLASAGVSALVAGDKITVYYEAF